jgi:hypothetical protein
MGAKVGLNVRVRDHPIGGLATNMGAKQPILL